MQSKSFCSLEVLGRSGNSNGSISNHGAKGPWLETRLELGFFLSQFSLLVERISTNTAKAEK